MRGRYAGQVGSGSCKASGAMKGGKGKRGVALAYAVRERGGCWPSCTAADHQKNIKVVRVAPGALIKGGDGYQDFIKMLAAPSVNLLF